MSSWFEQRGACAACAAQSMLAVPRVVRASQILQVNTRWKALAEITQCTPLHRFGIESQKPGNTVF